jgi:hypothetical protein
MSAFGDKADMALCTAHVRFWLKADMTLCGNPSSPLRVSPISPLERADEQPSVRCDARVSFLLFQTVSFDTSAGSCLNSNPYEGKFGTFLRIPLGMIACTFSDPGLGQEQTMKAL